jgi:hypothetical protein
MKILKLQISDRTKYLAMAIIEGSVIVFVLIFLFVFFLYKEPTIIKTTGVVSKLELTMDEPPSKEYVRVSLKNETDFPIVTDLKTAESLHLNHKYIFFTKSHIILSVTETNK